MNELHHKRCIPCEGGLGKLEPKEIEALLKRIVGWTLQAEKNIHKEFHFENFKEAMGFLNEVGDVAEYEGHHPDMHLHNWNKVTISLSTHALKGLSENDFIMASKIDRAYKEMKE